MTEPVQITVVTPDEQVVVKLLVDPHKQIVRTKNQIEGLEGTAAGNQVLLLDGAVLDDHSTFADVGATACATVVMLRCYPVLLGSLTPAHLKRFLQDEAALVQAIDAHTENLQYSVAELKKIATSVAVALFAHDKLVCNQLLQTVPLSLLESPEDVAVSQAHNRLLFIKAVKKVLEVAQKELSVHDQVASPKPVQSTGGKMAGVRTPENLSDQKPCMPYFKGAGVELRERLHRRLSAINGSEDTDADKPDCGNL